MKILAPLDGTAESEAVLPWAEAFLGKPETSVDLLHVSPGRSDEEEAPGGREASWVPHDCARYLDRVRDRLAAWSGRVRVVAEVGPPAAAILRAVRASAADLLLLRTRSRQGVSRLLFGSTAAEVLQGSPVPVLMLGPGARKPEVAPAPRRVLVPLDGSDWSARILADATRLARLFGASMTLFHAGRDIPGLGGLAERLSGEGFPCAAVEGSGDAAAAILGHVGLPGCDVVAMATHGRSGLSKLILGSVAERVVRECPVPVLLRRPG